MNMSARRRSIIFTLFAIPATVILGIALAGSHGDAAAPEASPTSQTAPYLPSISDQMIATIQPRHRRLWQAAQNKDWDFAAYELGNLHGALQRLGQAYPTEHGTSLPDMIASVTEQPFTELKSAISFKGRRWLRQGLCRSDVRMQRMPPGLEPRCRRDSGAERHIHFGPGFQFGGALKSITRQPAEPLSLL